MIIRTVNDNATGNRARAGRGVALTIAVVAALLLAACGGGSGAGGGSAAPSGSGTDPSAADGSGSAAGGSGSAGTVSVVASTNVWGDIVEQVGGDRVSVRSVISDPSADPHSYQANAQVQLALSKAQLVVENGGGYDDFMTTMVASASSTAPVVNAVDISGKAASSGQQLNEHVWYDLPTVGKVAETIATDLGAIDPANRAAYQANAVAFSGKLAGLTAEVDRIKAQDAGAAVAVTEAVPLYLVQAAGLENLTPDGFSEAIENETDVPPDILRQTLALFSDKKVKALVYNEQTTGPQTEAVLQAAKDNSVAVVPVTEILPESQDYLTWMDANIKALQAALNP